VGTGWDDAAAAAAARFIDWSIRATAEKSVDGEETGTKAGEEKCAGAVEVPARKFWQGLSAWGCSIASLLGDIVKLFKGHASQDPYVIDSVSVKCSRLCKSLQSKRSCCCHLVAVFSVSFRLGVGVLIALAY